MPRLLAALTLVALTPLAVVAGDLGRAAAQPDRPAPTRPSVPPGLQVDSVSGPLELHVVRRSDGLRACAVGERRLPFKARVTIRWNRDGKTSLVSVGGGSARFNRCAAAVLRGWVGDVKGRGGATARVVVDGRGPVPPLPPDPPPPRVTALEACTVAADCTIYFRFHGCVAGDPVAVNAGQLELARKTYPIKREACAMGGPQYDRLRRSNENRWSTTCEAGRCGVHDAGARDPLGF